MEIFDTALFAAILGLGMSFLTEVAKKLNFHPKAFLLGLSVGAGVAITLFDTLVPAIIRENVVIFVQATLGTAVLIYDFLVKPFKEHLENADRSNSRPPKNFDV